MEAEANQPGSMRWYVGALHEMRERVFDQASDLTAAELAFVAPSSQISIGWLLMHMTAGEARWVGRLTGSELPGWLESAPAWKTIRPYGEVQPAFGEAADIIAFSRRIFDEWTAPSLLPLEPDHPGPHPTLNTAAAVTVHLVWHWNYHSGQLGLIRLQAGSEYDWTF